MLYYLYNFYHFRKIQGNTRSKNDHKYWYMRHSHGSRGFFQYIRRFLQYKCNVCNEISSLLTCWQTFLRYLYEDLQFIEIWKYKDIPKHVWPFP